MNLQPEARAARRGAVPAAAGLLALCVAATAALAVETPSGEAAGGAVDFIRHVKPILADRCYTCHGPDARARQAGLRFDRIEEVIDYGIIVPGKPEESYLLEKVTAERPRDRMPPPESGRKPLSAGEVELVRRWIAGGAEVRQHWSFVPPERPAVPEVDDDRWARGAIDRFIAAEHQRRGLRPAPPADRRTLLRRLSFDLIGLPPSPDQVDAFVADDAPGAYERQVERLLASPHFGERMAVYWLDVVRYADSGGYHSDNAREVSMYRDYVIAAFTDNKPFDQFVVEQLAGDLLPDPTQEQRVATAYNRLLQTTEEGGAQPKEYTAKYQADRVRNTGAALLGLTLGCAECHDHKFDPISQKEFYSFAAFFADVKERAVGRQEQTRFPSEAQQKRLDALEARIAKLRETLATQNAELDAALARWEETARDDKKTPETIREILAVEPDQRDEKQRKKLAEHFRSVTPLLESQRSELKEAEQARDRLREEIPSCLVTESVSPHTVRVLPRGNWQDDSGEVVEPAVPAVLRGLDTGPRRATRLDLAHWLVARDHPLVARVLVNRLWMLLFGRGIARSVDDLGSQGTPPTHPELLDWLAVELVDSGWDVKHLVRLMVQSSTYRQSSLPPDRQAGPGDDRPAGDAPNDWFTRQARFRLEAEFVRDAALKISGLLSPKIGGRSVKPYQPKGFWQHLNFPKRTWKPSRGEDLYRRGLYTWWQRTFLHPSLAAFDAPSREESVCRRARSNTPLQALVLLNDPTYVEAARGLAERALRDGGADFDPRLAFVFREALSRPPRPEELETLRALHAKHLAAAAEDASMEAILQVGARPVPEDLDRRELVAWTSVARVVLNLHETITRN